MGKEPFPSSIANPHGDALRVALKSAMEGDKLSEEEVALLEEHVRQSPKDMLSRSRLLSYYFLRHFDSEDAARKRTDHILWIIRNAPTSPVAFTSLIRLDIDPEAYQKARAIWHKHLTRGPVSRELLLNAASFLTPFDKDEAQALQERARELGATHRERSDDG